VLLDIGSPSSCQLDQPVPSNAEGRLLDRTVDKYIVITRLASVVIWITPPTGLASCFVFFQPAISPHRGITFLSHDSHMIGSEAKVLEVSCYFGLLASWDA